MQSCTDYEVELSALLDGESDPATAVKLMDHMTSCSSCRTFFGELRSFQSLVGEMPVGDVPHTANAQRAAGSTYTAEPPPAVLPTRASGFPRRWRWFGFGAMPRWAWGMAAAFAIVMGLWAVDVVDVALPPGPSGGELVIPLGKDEGSMDEGRFVEMVAELLRADRRYRDQMYLVLDEISDTESSNESPVFDGWQDGIQSELNGEVATTTSGRQVLN